MQPDWLTSGPLEGSPALEGVSSPDSGNRQTTRVGHQAAGCDQRDTTATTRAELAILRSKGVNRMTESQIKGLVNQLSDT